MGEGEGEGVRCEGCEGCEGVCKRGGWEAEALRP